MNFATAYIDESCSHAGSPVLVLAGFVYEREHAELLEQEWSVVLSREKIPFLHMKDFTKPGQKPYAHLSEPRKKELSIEFVDIIHRHRTLSFATVVNESDLTEVFTDFLIPVIFGDRAGVHSNYAWALMDCLKGIQYWADRTGFDGEIAYIFESDHPDQNTANAVMKMLVSNPETKRKLRYRSHTFSTKVKDPPLQTADIYAWLSSNFAKKMLVGNRVPRKDLVALYTNRHEHQANVLRIWNKAQLIELGVEVAGNAGLLNEQAIVHFLSKWKFE